MSTVYNKVVVNGTTYIDLSQDTVASASHIRSGYVGHLNNGTQVIGSYEGGSSTPNLQSKTNINPSTSSQTIEPDNGYDGLSSVQINAMPTGTAVISAAKGTVSNNSVQVTPNAQVTQAGYFSTGSYPGTAVTVSASELVSGTKSITSNGTNIDVTNYAAVDVAVSGGTVSLQAKTNINPTTSSQTIEPDNGYDGLSSVQINAMPTLTLPTSVSSSATSGYTSKATISRSTSDQYINIGTGYNAAGGYYKISAVANGSATAPASISGTSASISTGSGTITLTKTVSVTPSVTAGYISSGTAGNSSVSLTASVTVNPTPTASGATVTIPAGYYSSQTTKSVTSGSATGPTSLSGSSATVSTGTNTITLTKTGVTTTPTVSAGYVSSATASTATVALTASVTTKAAATITPTTTNQTIASGTYLTGTQTISGDSNLVASNIISGVSIFGVSGSVVIQHYYTGSSAPSSSLGSNGDIYLQTS